MTLSCITNMHAAVRKNRYVVLPVDFEEAWKVRHGRCHHCSHPAFKFAGVRVAFARYFSISTDTCSLSSSPRSRGQRTVTSSVSITFTRSRPSLTPSRPIVCDTWINAVYINKSSPVSSIPLHPLSIPLHDPHAHPHLGAARLVTGAQSDWLLASRRSFATPMRLCPSQHGWYFTGAAQSNT